MRGFMLLMPAVLLAQTTPAPAPQPAPKTGAGTVLSTDEQKIPYALGLSIQRSLAQFDLSPAELDLVKQGISDAAAGKPAVDLMSIGPKFEQFGKERASKMAAREKEASAAYLAKAAAEPGAVKTESGLVYKELTAGTGESPKATDSVKVNYRGTLTNGTEFDSSYKRNEPASFPLNGVIPCWTEGVQKMKPGGKATLVCPSTLAYVDQGRPPVIPGGATLVFEVELLEVGPPPAPAAPPAPPAASQPPQPAH